MPIYEYRCQDCQRKYSALIGMVVGADDESCPSCGSKNTQRLISRFTRGRTEDDRVDEMADELEMMGEPDSPSAMRQMVREMGKGMDDDMADDMEQMFEADMAGELEDDI